MDIVITPCHESWKNIYRFMVNMEEQELNITSVLTKTFGQNKLYMTRQFQLKAAIPEIRDTNQMMQQLPPRTA